VRYGAGAEASAKAIASLFGVTAVADGSVKAGHVEVLLGTGATVPSVSAASGQNSPAAAPTTGPQGGVVKPGKKFGIPCVN
jgi:hypothetical protein